MTHRPELHRPTTCRAIVALIFLTLFASHLPAQPPTFADATGHAFGERITQHHEMVRWVETLAQTSDRVTLVDQGRSWEGRRLLLAIVTSPENHARLKAIRETSVRLGDPSQVDPGELDALVAEQPAVVWIGGSIHGFELSGSEGVLKTLERLVTQNDDATRRILDNVVVLVDPMINPDGRDAFASYNHRRYGRSPDPRPESWANALTGWQFLEYRTSHYFFDINRDWFAHTQPETRHRVGTFARWRPQVAIDAHEMQPTVEFYFDPPDDLYAEAFPAHAKRWFERFNAAYAAAFDANGFEYMTGERYNYYYPGYTTSYNSYLGAVGMLYEQGTSNGLAFERPDGSVRDLAEALSHQATAAWAALETASAAREDLLREAHLALRDAMNAVPARGTRHYLLESGRQDDPRHSAELVDLLRRNGIEVGRLRQDVTLNGVSNRTGEEVGQRSFDAGTWVVDVEQARARLIHTLLTPDLPVPEKFLAEARQRLDRGQSARFYDITAWSLPLLFNLDVYGSSDPRTLETDLAAVNVILPGASATEPPEAEQLYAYLVDGRSAASMAVLYHLTDRGHRAAVLRRPTRLNTADGLLEVASGTVIVRVGQNDESIHADLRELTGRYRINAQGVTTGRPELGLPALGSGDVIPAKKARIALLAEDPVNGYSFGWAWHALEEQYGLPVTVLRTDLIANTPLDRFATLILPDLAAPTLAERFGEKGIARLKSWVADGGCLVAIAGAVDFVRDSLELTALRSWYDVQADAETPRRFPIDGAIVRGELDPEVWLSAGYPATELPFLVTSDRLVLPPDGPPNAARRVALRVANDGPRLSGHLWPESLKRLPGKVLAYDEKIGRGRVIAFSEDLNFRGFFRGADRLFLNAVVLGPSAP